MNDSLEAELRAAFPPVVIDRQLLDEPTAMWELQEDRDALVACEGKTWLELPDAFLYRNTNLLIWAGDGLWRTLLPAYLTYLLREHDVYNDLAYQVAGELTRGARESTQARFDRRMAGLSTHQLTVLRDVVASLATQAIMQSPMSTALASLNSVLTAT